jgi:hypothetical protein
MALPMLGLALLLISPAAATADMRCEGRLISAGDAKAELLARCGQPSSKSIVGVVRLREDASRVLSAYIDEWSYAVPGADPYQVLRFEGGRLVGDGLRCKGRLVGEGDTPARVHQLCGPPATRDAAGTQYMPAAPAPDSEDLVDVPERSEILIMQWVYDPGPGQFMKIVTLEGGRVTEITDGPRQE